MQKKFVKDNKVFLEKSKVIVIDTKIYKKMKNKSLLSIEKTTPN